MRLAWLYSASLAGGVSQGVDEVGLRRRWERDGQQQSLGKDYDILGGGKLEKWYRWRQGEV